MITSQILHEVNDWLNTQSSFQLTGTGPVLELESKIAKFYGKQYALCVTNATMGIWAVLRAKGIENSMVAGPAITWGGSYSGALLLQNNIHLLPSSDPGFTVSPEYFALAAREKKISAVIGVDFGGYPHDTSALREICDRYGIFYIADAAQSLGAFRDGLPAGALADAIIVSFGASKTLSAGEGAAILTNDRKLYEQIMEQTQHPFRQQKEISFSAKNECGVNLRIHPVAAIIANASFEERISNAQQRAAWIESRLEPLVQHQMVQVCKDEGIRSIWSRILLHPHIHRPKSAWKRIPHLLPGWKWKIWKVSKHEPFGFTLGYENRFTYAQAAEQSGYAPLMLELYLNYQDLRISRNLSM